MKHTVNIVILFISMISYAQVEKTSELFLTMKQLDSIVFEEGFNNCNMKDLEAILAKDLEFYHDVGGVQNKDQFIASMEQNICGNASEKLTRELVEGSLEVFPLKANDTLYGVLQRGEHEFYRQKVNEAKVKTGYAKFTSYWELQHGEWLLKRVFSFDHRAAK